MLLNLTNHKSIDWSDEQINIANKLFGSVIDYVDIGNPKLSFPNIPSEWSGIQVAIKAQEVFTNITNKYLTEVMSNNLSILLAGEFSFVIYFNSICQSNNIPIYIATSERNTIDNKDGTKTIIFNFVQFRKL